MIMRPQAIQRSRANKRFKGTFVDALEIDTVAEIEQILERPLLARFYNRLYRPLTNPLDSTKTVNDASTFIYSELEVRDCLLYTSPSPRD